jgi:hypothetical protein
MLYLGTEDTEMEKDKMPHQQESLPLFYEAYTRSKEESAKISQKAYNNKYPLIPEAVPALTVDPEIVDRRYFGTEKVRMKHSVEQGSRTLATVGVVGMIDTTEYTSTLWGVESLNMHDARIVYAVVQLVQIADGMLLLDGSLPVIEGISVAKVVVENDLRVAVISSTKADLKRYLDIRDWYKVEAYFRRLSHFREDVVYKTSNRTETNSIVIKMLTDGDQVKIYLNRDFLDHCVYGVALDYNVFCSLDYNQHASALYEFLKRAEYIHGGRYVTIEESLIIRRLWGTNPTMVRTDHQQTAIKTAFEDLKSKGVITAFAPYKLGIPKVRFWAYSYDKFMTNETLLKLVASEEKS